MDKYRGNTLAYIIIIIALVLLYNLKRIMLDIYIYYILSFGECLGITVSLIFGPWRMRMYVCTLTSSCTTHVV